MTTLIANLRRLAYHHERCPQLHTRHVAQEFLIFWWSKFRYPMVLPSASGRPAGCERADHIWRYIWNLIDIDAISASEAMTRLMPINDQMYDQKSPARPPSTSPWVFALSWSQRQVRGVNQVMGLHQEDLPGGLQYGRKTQG